MARSVRRLLNAAMGFMAAFLLAFIVPASVSALDLVQDGDPVTIKTKPIKTFQIGKTETRFGQLEFLGGLEILSANRAIGGLSGLISLSDGAQFLAVTDNGHWVFGEIEQDDAGAPLDLANILVAPLRRQNGETFRRIWGHDTESLVRDGDTLLVSAERANAIYRFPWPILTGNERMLEEVAVPPEVKALQKTKGLEAIAVGPARSPLDGVIVAVGERGISESHPLPGFLISSSDTEVFSIERSDRYDATDAAFLPNGDFLLLERRFNMRDLVGMRLRQFESADLKPGAQLRGEVLLEADFTYQIDNMEALAVHQTKDGDTILTVLSDNNRSLLQRTLLLRFKLINAEG